MDFTIEQVFPAGQLVTLSKEQTQGLITALAFRIKCSKFFYFLGKLIGKEKNFI